VKKTSIILRCKNNWKLTKACIESIQANTDTSLYSLIVVDDGSTDETRKELDAMATTVEPKQIFIHHEKSLGAVTATNTGLKYVFENPTSYILILDNDTEVLKGNKSWLQDMINWFDDTTIGAVGACSDGEVIGLQNVAQLTNNKEPKFLISFCMMMSFKCAKAVGLWDESLNPGNGEDIDFSFRARRAGYNLAVAKDVFIKHIGHQTFGSENLQSLVLLNEHKLISKYGEKIYHTMRWN